MGAQPKMKLAERVKKMETTTRPARPVGQSATEQSVADFEIEPVTARSSARGVYVGAKARQGKKATVGHFSEEMSRTLNAIAALEGSTLQALMGEAWDDLLVKRGREPFGER